MFNLEKFSILHVNFMGGGSSTCWFSTVPGGSTWASENNHKNAEQQINA